MNDEVERMLNIQCSIFNIQMKKVKRKKRRLGKVAQLIS